MSLVTRCPACATTFKVVRDQLRISDGWVRCGRCSEVFDATLDLQESGDAPSAPVAPKPGDQGAPAPEPPADARAQQSVGAEPGAAPESADDSAKSSSSTSVSPDALAETDFLDDDQEVDVDDSHAHDDERHRNRDDRGDDGDRAREPARLDDPLVAGFASPEPRGAAAPAADDPDLAAVPTRASWPEAEALLLGERGRSVVRPPPPPPLSFPDIDMSLPVLRAMEPSRDEALPDRSASAAIEDDPGNAQLAKALRRARAKSAKIAKARAREAKSASMGRAPMPTIASEHEAPLPASAAAAAAPVFADLPPPFALPESASASFWARPWVRRSLWGLAVLAALLVLLQVLLQQRDLIAARQPSLRPMLVSLCGSLGCELSALRQINDIKIDGASFAREKTGDGFQLSFTLRNGAAVPLAMPAVELSLLDTQERAVVRRVLMPPEFGAPSVLPARSERTASLSLNLSGPEAAALPPVVGFRLEALYP